MFEALAMVLAAIIGAGTTAAAGETAANEAAAAREQSLGLANISRQDALAQQKASNDLSKLSIGLSRQSIGLSREAAAEGKRQFNITQNRQTADNVIKTIGDAATKSAAFKNYILSRQGF